MLESLNKSSVTEHDSVIVHLDIFVLYGSVEWDRMLVVEAAAFSLMNSAKTSPLYDLLFYKVSKLVLPDLR